MKKTRILFVFLLMSIGSYGQNNPCDFTLTCTIIAIDSKEPIARADVQLSNNNALYSNHLGQGKFNSLCAGTYRVTYSHADYATQTEHIYLRSDTSITLYMHPRRHHIDSVDVVGHSHARHALTAQTLTAERRLESQGRNLAEVLTDIAGVNILRTGSNIAKPILNGLYGSRLLLINNQVRHESQQWGVDHAPEIDPFAAQEITVIKNADAVRYGPDALAGVILINPAPINTTTGVHGGLYTVVQSNGRSGAVHAELEGGLGEWAYRIGGTTKKSGNIKTAEYYLGNTGAEELNFNGLLRYKTGKNMMELSYNRFGTTMGIFEGAHIGSKEDIMVRIAHGRPFEDYDFSYRINAPRQQVQQDLAKLSWKHQWSPYTNIETTYSIQQNRRKEYDLRRVQSDEVPMADMVLTTQTLEVLAKSRGTTFGVAGSLQVNNNTPGTGTTPIIPNFDNHTIGVFAAQKHHWGRNLWELGLRYDYKYFDVAGYRYDYNHPNADGTVNQYLLTDQRHFNNLSGIAGLSIGITGNLFWKSHIGLAWRAPSANELYSDGIHHGTGTYEVGSPHLKSEKGIKWVNNIHLDKEWLIANADIFVQSIVDYSYAQPNPDSIRQTIRGTFPLFQYQQTDAFLYGADFSITVIPRESVEYTINLSTVIGRDRTNKTYLPYMPSDRLQQSLLYRVNKAVYLRLSHLYVAQQERYEAGSDYTAPPPAYHLFGVLGSYHIPLRKQQRLSLQLAFDNILNAAYKDYMDRFRYYAHLLGRTVSLKLNYNF